MSDMEFLNGDPRPRDLNRPALAERARDLAAGVVEIEDGQLRRLSRSRLFRLCAARGMAIDPRRTTRAEMAAWLHEAVTPIARAAAERKLAAEVGPRVTTMRHMGAEV
jgi:hypothetical protein